VVALTLSSDVILHGPFRVATGNAKPGFDDSVDIDNPVPASIASRGLRSIGCSDSKRPSTCSGQVATHKASW